MSASKSSVGVILLLYAAGLGAGAQLGKVATSFTLLREVYPASDTTQGLLLSIVSFFGMLLGVVAGQLVASQGYKRMMLFGLGLGGLMSLLQAGLPRIEIFMVSRLIEGASHLAIVVAAPTLMNRVTEARHRYLSMTLWSSTFGVAFAVLAPLSPVLVGSLGLGGFYGVHGIYMLALAVILFFVLPKSSTIRAPLPRLREVLERHRSAYGSPYESPASLGWLFFTLSYVAILAVLPPFLPEDKQVAAATYLPVASILSSFLIGAVILRFWSAVSVVQIGFAAATAAALWMCFGGVSVPALMALFLALGVVQASSFAVIPELNDTAESQALATGAVAQMGNVGNALGTPLLLGLVGVAGIAAFPIALIALYVAAIGCHAYTHRLRQRG